MTFPIQKPCSRRLSVKEYLDAELKAEVRHEFHDGEVLAMSGGSLYQSLINANLIRELGVAMKGKPCRVADSNLRVRVLDIRPRYVYPDALVYCGVPQFDQEDSYRHTLVNPRVIVEVLSPSTEAYDRGAKFALYRTLESLKEYVMISQDKPGFESWLRQADGAWSIETCMELPATAKFRSLKVEIPMAEIYAGVEFPGEQ